MKSALPDVQKILFQFRQTILHNYNKQKNYAAQYQLPPGADRAFEIKQIKNYAEQKDADQRWQNASLPARQKSSADDDRRNCLMLIWGSGDSLSLV